MSATIILKITGAVCVLAALTGCNSATTPPLPDGLTMCPEERPQICTREYNPVCASLTDGGTKTYATGCTACADPLVTGWIAGACPESP
jgi:hypothetical protein